MRTYRFYRWGQRVDIYNHLDQLFSISWAEIQWEAKTPWAYDLRNEKAAAGDVYSINLLKCREEMVTWGIIPKLVRDAK